ncbi:MAG: helix-turn-helix transcriptional regulator [Clostridia bacterium]|nr:helix-turn-helix transcriptional regulator [Clostridia bacterium]
MLPIAEKIRTLRKERGITQDELASALRVSFQSVSRWENGQTYPDIELIPKIAAYFGVTTDELLVEKGESVLKEERERKRSEYYNSIWSENDPAKKCDLALRAFREFPDDYRFAVDALRELTSDAKPRDEGLPIARELCTLLLNQDTYAFGRTVALRWMYGYEDEERLSDWQKYLPEWSRAELLEFRYSETGNTVRMDYQKQANLFESLNRRFPLGAHRTFGNEEDTARSIVDGCHFTLRLFDLFRDPAEEVDLWIQKRAWTYLYLAKGYFRLGKADEAFDALEKSAALYEIIIQLPPDMELTCHSPLLDCISACRMNWFCPNEERSPAHQDSDYINICSALDGSDEQWAWFDPYREDKRFKSCLERIREIDYRYWTP